MEVLAKNLDIHAVICNVPGAAGIEIAQNMGIECIVEPSLDGIKNTLDSINPDLICMAGFMRILPSKVTEKYEIMNIHPSLLPLFPGLHAQRQALKADELYSGCTVHMADAGVDTGKIILQDAVPIVDGDDEDTLSDRIIVREHQIYTKAVRLFFNRNNLDDVKCDNFFDTLFNAATFAAKNKDDVLYLWKQKNKDESSKQNVIFAVSESSPIQRPYVISAPYDEVNVIYARLENAVLW